MIDRTYASLWERLQSPFILEWATEAAPPYRF